nr:hypothetical protein [Beijerinckia indica]
MLVDAGSDSFFATVNVQSSKGSSGSPVAETYLNFLVDGTFAIRSSNTSGTSALVSRSKSAAMRLVLSTT